MNLRLTPARGARSGLALLAAGIVLIAGRGALNLNRGLQATYFSSLEPGAPAALTLVSADVSTAGMVASWSGQPPGRFRARWFGYLTVFRPGLYTFATTSDDGSSVAIDGRLVVDNGGIRGTTTGSGEIELDAGAHAVLIEYLQAGGAYEMQWSWARAGGTLSPVPGWRLSTRRVARWRVAAGRAIDWLLRGVLAVLLLVGIGVAWPVVERAANVPGPDADNGRTRIGVAPQAASLVLFVALAVLHTWPLASDPARLSRNDNGDALLNEWTLAWVAHQIVRDPLDLFQANIFHPEPYTLAYSEALIVQSALAAPLLWLGASPVLAYNLVLLTGFALTGWAMSLVVVRWTGSWTAALVSGCVFGVSAHTLTRLPHLQAQHVEFLPLALLVLDRLLREPTRRRSVALALWFTLQALTSVYLLVLSAFGLTAAALSRPDWWAGRRAGRVALHLGVAAGVAVVLLAPFLLPYWRLHEQHGMTRTLADAAQYGATWGDYLSTPARVHYALWSHRWFVGTALFPGALGLALAAVALLRGRALGDVRARMCLAAAVCGVLLSFGARLPGYAALYDVLPLLHSIRAPVRFGYLATLGTAVLAGFGVVALRRGMSQRARMATGPTLIALAALEPLAAPLQLTEFPGIPAIYSRVRHEPGAIVAELPLARPRAIHMNAKAVLNSTRHFKPMLNGYSGFVPPSYFRHVEALAGFPDNPSIRWLQSAGVTHLFVHVDELGAAAAALDRQPALDPIAREGPITLYAVRPPGEVAAR